MNLILRLIILIISVFVAAFLIPGVIIDSTSTLVVVAILLGVANTFLKPILVVLTIPLTILTLGIFLLVLNGLLVLLVGSVVPGFHVSGILTAILFSIVVSVISSLLSSLS